MFRIGFFETLIIALVVLLIVKPKNLPGFFRKAGQLFGQARQAYHSFMNAIRSIERAPSKLLETGSGSPGTKKKTARKKTAQKRKRIISKTRKQARDK